MIAGTALLIFACLMLPSSRTEAAEVLIPSASIPVPGVEGRFDHLAFDRDSQTLFIAALENHTVEVVDLKKRKWTRRLTGINEPQGLFYIPQKNRLLVCSRGDGTCRSFDATTGEEGPWVDVGRNADNIRFDPQSQIIFVGSAGEPGPGLLSAIDLTSLLPAAQGGIPAPPRSPADLALDRPRQGDPKMEIEVPAHPESFQLDTAHQRLFVNVPDEHQIIILHIGSTNFTRENAWPVTAGDKNFPMIFDPNSSRVFIACRKGAFLVGYDTRSGSQLFQTPCVGDADDMYYDPERHLLYVIGGEGFVDVFHISDAAVEEPKRTVHQPTAARARTGLFIPELRMLAVAAPHVGDFPASILLFQTAR